MRCGSICWTRRRCGRCRRDRKSTRLNSSHSQISYAVFCLKKKIKILMIFLIIRFLDMSMSPNTHLENLTLESAIERFCTTLFFVQRLAYTIHHHLNELLDV